MIRRTTRRAKLHPIVKLYPQATSGHRAAQNQPSTEAENEFIEAHGWDEYANWHLGVDDEASEHTKARYKFPYGDFERVHRCGLIAAEVRCPVPNKSALCQLIRPVCCFCQ